MILNLSLNPEVVFKESLFYLNWAKKSKNLKTKRKLILKSKKELDILVENRDEYNRRMKKGTKIVVKKE